MILSFLRPRESTSKCKCHFFPHPPLPTGLIFIIVANLPTQHGFDNKHCCFPSCPLSMDSRTSTETHITSQTPDAQLLIFTTSRYFSHQPLKTNSSLYFGTFSYNSSKRNICFISQFKSGLRQQQQLRVY